MNIEELGSPLGIHKDSHEFQVCTTIVWVYTNVLGVSKSLEIANHNFELFWGKISQVIALAEIESRKKYPELWSQHEMGNAKAHPLSVWGIWYYPDSGETHYEVNMNHDYPYGKNLPEFPEEEIMVEAKGKSIVKVI